jgi:DNA end-binding protein Ku
VTENNNTTGRKVWSGTLSFGLVSVPVALFPAAREEKIAFNQLHSTCKSQLKQPAMQCPSCNTAVEKKDIVKGYKVAENQFITVSKEELESVSPASSKKLEISEFVPETDVDPVYFESSFFLTVSEGGEKPYSLIREAMLLKGVVAIAKLTYSSKEQLALVRPVAGGLMLHTLYWNYEVRNAAFTRLPEVSDKELSIACQLVDALATKFDHAHYSDQYRANTLDMIERKKAGETITTSTPDLGKKPPVADISAALFASIAAVKASRPAAGGIQ